jgi:hypothetical protein
MSQFQLGMEWSTLPLGTYCMSMQMKDLFLQSVRKSETQGQKNKELDLVVRSLVGSE